MIETIKEKIAEYIVKKNLAKKSFNDQKFTGFFSRAFSFFVIMPESEDELKFAYDIIDYLDAAKKEITIFTHDFRVSLMPQKYRAKCIDYGVTALNKINLPAKPLVEKITSIRASAVIDLNREPNIFYSYIANLVSSDICIGFKKKDSDKYYNLQVGNSTDDPQISYKNLLNCLEMF